MAIAIYPPLCDDFSTNGLGLLAPLECTVEEQAAGLYELKLVHPIDEARRWTQIVTGCIIKAPVPVRETPLYEYVEDASGSGDATVERRVYRVRTNGGNLHLRQKPGTSSKILAKYPPGTEVLRLKDVGNGWYQVSVCRGGAQGYMYAHWLEYVRTVREVVSGAKVVGKRTVAFVQSREQLFRVSSVETDSEAGTVTATARHIFYDLSGNLIDDAYEPENVEAEAVIGEIAGKLLNESEFTIRALGIGGKVTADYGYKSPVEALLDPEEGVAAQAGALVVRDNYDVYLLPDVVRDNGVTVRRGKNLRGVTVTGDMSDVVTRIIPEGKTKDGEPLYLTGTKYVDSPRVYDYPTILAQRIEYDVKVVDKKDADGETTFADEDAARAKLRELAEAEFSENEKDLPAYGMEVDFVLLREPEAYVGMQSVYLYDTVTVIDELIGLKAKLRVTGYTWNALTRQYERVTLGEVQESNQTVYSYNLKDRGISGKKLAQASVGTNKISKDAREALTDRAVSAVAGALNGGTLRIEGQLTQLVNGAAASVRSGTGNALARAFMELVKAIEELKGV